MRRAQPQREAGSVMDPTAERGSRGLQSCSMPPALQTVTLRNFRRFRDHEVAFSERTLLVGANNAGKSTVIQALSLVSLVANRVRGLNFTATPEWLAETPAAAWGVSPSLRGVDITLGEEVFYAYGEPPGIIRADFATKWSIEVFVGVDDVFAIVRDASGRAVSARRDIPRGAIATHGDSASGRSG